MGRFNSWATAISKVIAILVFLGVAVTWLITQIEGSLSVFLAATTALCALAVTGSISIAAWRYFKPLSVPATTTTQATDSVSPELLRAVQVLTHSATDTIALSLLDNSIKAAPSFAEIADADLTCEECAERIKGMESYLAEARKTLRPSYRGDSLQGVLDMAANFADHEVRAMPAETRPNGLDPFQFRQYRMVKAQFDRCLSYLKHERSEALETHGGHMTQLREALRRLEDASLRR